MSAWMMERNPGIKKAPPHHPPRGEWVGVSVVFEGEWEDTVICDFRYAISDFRSGEAAFGNLSPDKATAIISYHSPDEKQFFEREPMLTNCRIV